MADVLGPLAELLGYLLLPLFWLAGALNIKFILAFFALFCLFGVFISLYALLLEEIELRRHLSVKSLLLLAWVAIIENFGYRQLNNYWRIVGWWQFLRKKKDWGSMPRRGALQNTSP